VILTFDLWPWKSIGFQILLRIKYVPSLVKIHWRMLILECSQGLWRTDGRTDGSVTISPRQLSWRGDKKKSSCPFMWMEHCSIGGIKTFLRFTIHWYAHLAIVFCITTVHLIYIKLDIDTSDPQIPGLVVPKPLAYVYNPSSLKTWICPFVSNLQKVSRFPHKINCWKWH
jgi:hypothetical protein